MTEPVCACGHFQYAHDGQDLYAGKCRGTPPCACERFETQWMRDRRLDDNQA